METVLAIIVPIISIAIGIATYFIGRTTAARKQGEENGILSADIQYIKRRVDDVLLEQKDTNKTLDSHAERITRVEESAKQAHKRITDILTDIKVQSGGKS